MKLSYLFIGISSLLLGQTPAEWALEQEPIVIENQEIEIDQRSLYRGIVEKSTHSCPVTMQMYEKLEKFTDSLEGAAFSGDLVLKAAAFAAEKHAGHKRKNSSKAYVSHVLSVALILIEEGKITDIEVIAAAILHDTLAITDAVYEEIASQFSERVAHIVQQVNHDPELTSQTKHGAIMNEVKAMSSEAKLIKQADRIDNLRVYNEHEFDPDSSLDKRKRAYFEASIELAKILKGQNENLDRSLDEQLQKYFTRSKESFSQRSESP